MALRLTITETVKTQASGSIIRSAAPTEIEIEQEFYCRVNKIYGSKHEVRFTLAYLSEDGTDDDGNPVRGQTYASAKEFAFVPNNNQTAKNWLVQAYAHLKTLPEFADAVDC